MGDHGDHVSFSYEARSNIYKVNGFFVKENNCSL